MAKRPSLAALAHTAPAQTPAPAATVQEPTEEQPMLPMAAPKVQANRAGKRVISAYFEPEMARAMAILCAKNDRLLQDMMREAFNDLLRKYGEHPVGTAQ